MVILIFTLLIGLLVNLTIRFYRKNWSKNLELAIRFGSDAVVEGEKGELLQTVVNKKMLPLWWGDLQFGVSGSIRFDDGESMDHDYFKKTTVSALSYEMVRKVMSFTAMKRGYYTVEKAELLTGDLFFRYKFIRRYSVFTELYVTPQIKPVVKFGVDFKKIVGEIIAKRHVIEDPFEFRGIRDYYPFDSLKTVNWNATAKTGEIKVNQYHYTSSQEVVLLLDLEGYNSYDKPEIREDVIRIAAYLAHSLLENGIPVGLITNCRDCVTGRELSAQGKNGSGQQQRLLRLFARIDADKTTRPFARIVEELAAGRRGPHFVLISCYAGADLQDGALKLRATGHSLQWLLVKERERPVAVTGQKNLTICEADY